jgi:cyanate lyase
VNEIHKSKTGGEKMNRAELRAEIARKQISNRDIAKALGISEQAFYNKIGGQTEFKESEIKALVAVLGLSPEDVNRIFLA